jgi:hypothetical protein
MKKMAQIFGLALTSFSFLVLATTALALDAPTITATAKGPNQINLAWGPVDEPGWGYKVEIQSDGDSRYVTWTDITESAIFGRNYLPYWITEGHYLDVSDGTGITSSACTSASSACGTPCQWPMFSLQLGTTYNFRVRSYCQTDNGQDVFSSYSNTAQATTRTPSVIRYVRTDGNDSNDGRSDSPAGAWQTLSYAANQATAGTLVLVREGLYTTSLSFKRSGTQANRIWFQASPGETVTIGGECNESFIVTTNGHSYIVLDGFTITRGEPSGNRNSILFPAQSVRCVAANCNLDGSNGAASSHIRGSYNMFHGNYAHDYGSPSDATAGDCVVIWGNSASHNIVQFAHHSKGWHSTGLVRDGVTYCQWKNILHDGGGGLGFVEVGYAGTPQYNLYEGNIVADVAALAEYKYDKPGIMASGDFSTYRRNVVFNGHDGTGGYPSLCSGLEVSTQGGNGASWNLFYNNIFYHNGGLGTYVIGTTTHNVFANNIFYANGKAVSRPYSYNNVWYAETWTGSIWKNNLVLQMDWTTKITKPNYPTWNRNRGNSVTVAFANSNYPEAKDNITADSGFIDREGYVFNLKSTSAAVDSGVSVTDSVWGTVGYDGGAPDIGAFELWGSPGPPASPRNLKTVR